MHLGLRAKSALALLGAILLVLALAIAIGGRLIQYIEINLGSAYARNVTRLNRQRILTPVLRELALAQQLANSRVTAQWLEDENNPAKKQLFFEEARQYQNAFADHSYFLIARNSRHYYFNDTESTFSDQPRYSLKQDDPNDAWFFTTMKGAAKFNINVNVDTKLHVTKVWFNILVKNSAGRNIGLAGTGLTLTSFLDKFINDSEMGVTPIIINSAGNIQAYRDPKLIDYSSVDNKRDEHSTIFQLFEGEEDAAAMRRAMDAVRTEKEQIPLFWAHLNGKRELLALASLPELNWFVVTAVDLKSAHVLDSGILVRIALAGIALLIILTLAVMAAVNRVVLAPLLGLTHSVNRAATGDYQVELPRGGNDELGQLTRSFASLTRQVQQHTSDLEQRVAERTTELVEVNRKIDDSIQYARLIQNAILPGREMDEVLGEDYFVLWQPRDIVGGDFYVFRATSAGCLLGIIDCAGHGVPGAFMTMITHSALNVAIETLGIADPAALLTDIEERIRAILQDEIQESHVATHLDAGLVYIDYGQRLATYSGAKTSLYYCRGTQIEELKGRRRAIGGKRVDGFTNLQRAVTGDARFYFTTDGLLDQAGGQRGFGFGNRRFHEFVRRHSHLPFREQRKVLLEQLARYQGSLPQRDDITVMGFQITHGRKP